MTMKESLGPMNGYIPELLTFNGWNRTGGAVAVGDVLSLDTIKSQAESTSVDPITATGDTLIYANLITPTAATILDGDMVVVTDLLGGTGADNTLVKVAIEGIVSAFVIKASGNIAIGDPLVATTAKNMDGIINPGAAAFERVVAQALTAHTAPTSRVLGTVRLFGEMQGRVSVGS